MRESGQKSRLLFPPLLALFGLFLIGCPAGAGTPREPAPRPRVSAGEHLLTLESVYGPVGRIDMRGNLPTVVGWTPDGEHYIVYDDNGHGDLQMQAVDVATGKRAPLYDAAKLEASIQKLLDSLGDSGGANEAYRMAYRPPYAFDNDRKHALLRYGNDLLLVTFADCSVVQLTDTPDEVKECVTLSPDSRHAAFVARGGDLCVVDVDAPKKERVLSHPPAKSQDGKLDWVYEEELYGRGHPRGYEWSPDSKRIAFLRLDETAVKPFSIVDQTTRAPEQVVQNFPLAGDPNPIVTLGVVSAQGPADIHFVDLSRYPELDRLVVRLSWSPDSKRVLYQVQNRVQTFLDLDAVDAAHPEAPSLRLIHETTPAWVDVIGTPVWLKNGGFLWQSDRSGSRQIYQYTAEGALLRALTHAEAGVSDVFGVDAANRWVYFSAHTTNPIGRQVYRAPVTEKPDAPVAPAQLLTHHDGEHVADFSPTFRYFLDNWSNLSTPDQIGLVESDSGRELNAVGVNNAPLQALSGYKISAPELLQIPARDGAPLQAMLIRPPDFDPHKKYPVFCPVYGGPNIPTVENRWGGSEFLYYQLLAQKGYIVWLCDNRSARDNVGDAWPIHDHLGVAELNDVSDGIAYLKSQPWVDGSRIGISGWSYGGFLVEYALTHSKLFKIGIAGAGVSDWRLYDTIYTERYMDTPVANPDGYRQAAPVTAARDCSGTLLIIHGMMDDNVHLQNSVDLIYALERGGVQFDMMFYAGRSARHGIGDPALNRHLQSVMYDFILKNL